MRKILPIIIILAFSVQLYAANVFSEASAIPSTNRVVLSWVTKSETNIKSFLILRSNDDKVYISLATKTAKGPGTRYEYIDQNVMFKDFSPVFYKIRALDSAGQMIEETAVIAHPNISGIFQTWGAIKKLFR